MNYIPLFVALTALSVLMLTSWKTQKWVAMTGLSLFVGGLFVFVMHEEYVAFSFYLFQTLLILLGTAFFVRGRNQKLLIGVSTAFLVAASLIKDSLLLDHLANIEFTIYLYTAYALIPLLFYSPVLAKEENLEKLICFQQTWLRILFFNWAVDQGVNISHYDLFRRFIVEFGWLAVGVILIGIILRRRLFWSLLQQSVISLFVLGIGLGWRTSSVHHIYAWIFLLSLSVLLPKNSSEFRENITRFIKRMEFGAFGGGVFWSLIFVVHIGTSSSMEGLMLWTAIIFILGLLSWMREIPRPDASLVGSAPRKSELFLLGTRAVVQLLLAFLYIYPL